MNIVVDGRTWIEWNRVESKTVFYILAIMLKLNLLFIYAK